MQPTPLPLEIQGVPFRVRDAELLGVPAGRLRAADLFAPYRGVRAPHATPMSTVLDRCVVLEPRLSGAHVFSHLTAAALWGMPLPAWCAHEPLDVSALPGTREPRLPGIRGHRLRLRHDELTLAQGMPVPHPTVVWAQCGRMLRLDDLIVLADHLLNEDRTADDLVQAIRPGVRGAVTLRAAVAEARVGSESPRETLTRLALVRGGLPEPEPNMELRGPDGRFVARLDLAYRRWRVCVEYDGRQHADGDQFRRDADRWAEIEANGWVIVRVLAHHFSDPGRLIVGRTRAALAARGYRA